MRLILAEHARRRREEKHGGQWIKVHVKDVATVEEQQRSQFIELNDALEELARLNPRLAQVVELNKLLGLTHQETAAILDLSEKRYEMTGSLHELG
jgi:DNA-directed RNA polymerase specialized sigma24 family protein